MDQSKTIEDYHLLLKNLLECSANEKVAILRHLCRTDLFFLLWYGLGRKDIARPWLMDRCFEVQQNPNGYLDLWAREHYKSTIITYGKTIQDILSSHGDNPLPFWKGIEPTFGLFSCTRPLAKGFMRQIKRELESNDLLKDLFPDILYKEPAKEAIKWSEDDGLIVKRKSNPKEATIEAWGLIDGQPTGKHYFARIYDDVVTIDNCRSPQMIEKTTEAWELSINLGADGGLSRYIGTRYHFNDTYKTIMERKAAIPRVYTATVDGSVNGDPVLLSREALDEKRRFMGSYTFASQMLLNPNADDTQGFKEQDLRYYDFSSSHNLNVYIVVDPANEKKKSSDYTVMCVIGLGPDHNYYLLDLIRDRLNLRERGDNLFRLHKKWNPLGIGYEQYGMMADIAYIEEKMSRENYHFSLNKLGGNLSKIDRISRLIPIFEQGRFLIPAQMHYTDYEGKTRDLINIFINQEYKAFPVSEHDDMLDAMARILDPSLETTWPRLIEQNKTQCRYQAKSRSSFSSWGI